MIFFLVSLWEELGRIYWRKNSFLWWFFSSMWGSLDLFTCRDEFPVPCVVSWQLILLGRSTFQGNSFSHHAQACPAQLLSVFLGSFDLLTVSDVSVEPWLGQAELGVQWELPTGRGCWSGNLVLTQSFPSWDFGVRWVSFPHTGIFAYLNYHVPRTRREILETLIKGLQRLEYRGYDSAGTCLSCTGSSGNLGFKWWLSWCACEWFLPPSASEESWNTTGCACGQRFGLTSIYRFL